jgi:ankyrin repeat protein
LLEVTGWPSSKIRAWQRREFGGHRPIKEGTDLNPLGRRGLNRLRECEKTTLWHVPAGHGLYSVLTQILAGVEQNGMPNPHSITKVEMMDAKDSDDRTPLSHAAEFGDEKTVELLLTSKNTAVHVDSDDDFGKTPLFYAAETGSDAVTRLLLEKIFNIGLS